MPTPPRKATRGTIHIHVAKRDLGLASVRYRGLLPGCALGALGWRVEVGSGDTMPSPGSAVALSVKPTSAKDAQWVQKVASAGTPVIADLCDNVFIEGYGDQGTTIGDRIKGMCQYLAAMTVPTTALREEVVACTGLPVERTLLVSDIIETPDLLVRQRELLGIQEGLMQRVRRALRWTPKAPTAAGPVLLWFGNHGATYANYGLNDLLLFTDALAEAARRPGAELWVVSNHRERYEQLASQLPITCRYFDWTPDVVDALLPVTDVCLVPNSLDAFSLAKSANRAVKALSHQVPVIATPTAAYAELDGAVWLGDPRQGVIEYLDRTHARRDHLAQARKVIATHYSFSSLKRAMAGVLATVQGRQA